MTASLPVGTYTKTFRDSINQRRRDLGWSQAKVAELANVSRPTVSNFFAHHGNVRIETVARIVDVLGCEMAVRDKPKNDFYETIVEDWSTSRGVVSK